jgi:hypothetical protein
MSEIRTTCTPSQKEAATMECVSSCYKTLERLWELTHAGESFLLPPGICTPTGECTSPEEYTRSALTASEYMLKAVLNKLYPLEKLQNQFKHGPN